MNNSLFNIKRFGLLFKREYQFQKSFFLLATAGATASIFLLLLFLLSVNPAFKLWADVLLSRIYIVLFMWIGLIFCGSSFPHLRNSKKTTNFILTPNSTLEKYSFEFLTRIVLYILIFPFIFWVSANLAGFAYNTFTEEEYNLVYNFFTPFNELSNSTHQEGSLAIFLCSMFLYFSIPFVGATFFTKYPLLKTILAAVLFLGSTFLYIWSLVKFFKWVPINPELHIDGSVVINYTIVGLVLTTLVLHLAAYYQLTEKEA